MPMKDVVSCPEPVASVTAGNLLLLASPLHQVDLTKPIHLNVGLVQEIVLMSCPDCVIVLDVIKQIV